MKRKIFLLAALLCSTLAYSQKIEGTVKDSDGNPAIGAMIYWEGTTVGSMTDSLGVFTIHRVKDYNRLVTSYVGYNNDTTTIERGVREIAITMKSGNMGLGDVMVQGKIQGNYIEQNSIVKNETISFLGLCKMACCSLAESFENSAAVTVGYSDAISGARQIKMLGLVGTYTQMLDESRPIMRGINAPYGLSYTPGMWLSSIQVSKGISSVTAGSEAITGQVNLEYRKPTDAERLFVNGYINNEFRTELNVTTALPVTKDAKLSTILMFHGSTDAEAGAKDHNHDGFRDMPNTKQINFANRWLYAADNGFQLRYGVKYLEETRLGGEIGYDDDMRDDMFKGIDNPDNIYGSLIHNREANGYIKIGMPTGRAVYDSEINDQQRPSIAIVADFNHFEQDAYFGLNNYRGIENNFYSNLMYKHFFTYNSSIIFGATATLRSINEELVNYVPYSSNSNEILNIHNLDIDENILGGYAEYTYSVDNFSIILGARGDYNSYYKKSYFTPRGQIKWNVTPNTVVRGSAGVGYRSTNIITDNIGIMATGRVIKFDGGSHTGVDRLEEALTFGGSVTQTLSLMNENDATFSVDYFRTQFDNQVIVDQEYSANHIFIYNSDKSSYTDNYQVDFMWTPTSRIEVFATYRYTNSSMHIMRGDGSWVEVERPLVSRYKTLLNLQYATPLRRWVFDVTAQYNGPSRVPTTTGDLADSYMSPAYPMFFAQISKRINRIEIYLGCENIANYKQENPILGAENPFSTDFNSSLVWGPLMGRKFYAGFRFNLY